MKTTAITIKNLLFVFSLSILIATQKNHCMESNSDELSRKQLIKLKKACDNIDATYQNHRYSPMQATIKLQDYPAIGYGNQFCINALNEANIPTHQHQPLIPANIFYIDHTKETSQLDYNTDLTQKNPLSLRQEILTLTIQLQEPIEQKIKSLYSQNMTKEIRDLWNHNLAVSNHIQYRSNTLVNQCIPSLIPIHLLFSSAIKNITLFGRYNITFFFDEHEKLYHCLKYFHNTPLAITMLKTKTIEKINKRDRLLALNNTAFNNETGLLTNKITEECNNQAYKTNNELEITKIIHNQRPLENPFNILFLNSENTIIAAPLISHRHDTNGYTQEKLREDCFNDALLEKKMPLMQYLYRREITGK
jgi:hypothetical protein